MVHVGNFIKSSNSYTGFLLQQDQDFAMSRKIGAPVWYWQTLSLFSSSIKFLSVHPAFAQINRMPSFVITGFFPSLFPEF